MTDRIVGAPINAPLRDLVEHLVHDDNRTDSESEPDTTPTTPTPSTGGVSWR
ncbi:hypothetical protein [Streptomyces sp. NPDC088744]|uniref:hypothetical protein n=1 Tax=Streptomyces sp. NPDC088744 TaxID=3155061 RepID=UPI00344D90AE